MGELHVFFFPFMAQGHLIPMIDMAKLFSSRGVKTTIITTPTNAPLLTKSLEKNSGIHISIQLINFPSVEAGLPEGCELVDQLPSTDLIYNFFNAVGMLRDPLDRVLHEARPDCLVADMFFPWATDVAAQYSIPRLVFHGTSFFALSAGEHMRVCKPQKNVSSDSEPFVIPNLPHEVKLTRTQLPEFDREDIENGFTRMLDKVKESEIRSYGIIANTFYELEPAYADHFREVLGRKAWHIGPVSLCNRDIEGRVQRGREADIDENECLKWLDSKNPNSVIYVCFGSMTNFSDSQLYEMAMGIEASGQQFIWVVRKNKKKKKNGDEEEGKENWLPEGFEERAEGKGLIIRGWAPQLLILDHEAVGGFVTHCGWNSALEGVSAGVPMVTWPVFAEQFLNEKLLTDILRIGVGVGAQQWQRAECEGVKMEEIERALKQVMVGEGAEEMRNRAKGYKEMAKKAVEEGGSSYNDLNALIHELTSYHS